MADRPRWIPLESNPDVMNKFIHTSGVPKSFECYDVYGTDPGLLAMVPPGCCAVLLLFPSGTQSEFNAEQAAKFETAPQTISPNLFYMKQTIGNACGTIGLLHAVGNNTDKIALEDGSYIKEFLDATKSMTPAERGAKLEQADDIAATHGESAQGGQTEAPSEQERVDLHFIAFTSCDGELYELDGTKPGAVNHGPTTPETLLSDAAKVCQGFIDRGQGNLNFNMVALCPAQ